MNGQNPLSKFYRAVKFYTTLPSGTSYYNEKDVEFSEGGELGVLAMTSKDELILKNPDSLLNGEAVVQVIRSCVPGVKTPKKLLTNDLDVLLIAIRYATYGDEMAVEMECPNCQVENKYSLNLGENLDRIGKLENDYIVHLDMGLSIFVQPFTYTESLKALKEQFEQTKIARSMSDQSLSDDQRLKMFSDSYRKITELNYDLIISSIRKVVKEDEGICVEDKEQIKEFLFNIDKGSVEKIDKLIKEINQIGIVKVFKAVCQSCAHEWDAPIDFNPVNFFSGS